MPNNRSNIGPLGSWSRLKPVQQDSLESFGLLSKGDTRLLNHRTQESFYARIVDRYMTFCSDAGQGAELLRRFSALHVDNPTSGDGSVSANTPNKGDKVIGLMYMSSEEDMTVVKGLSDISGALRKLREGIVASKRVDDFAAQAYLFCIRVSILAKQPESYHPAILHLLRIIHPQHSLTPSEVEEVASYLVLDTVCRRKQLAEAITIRHEYKLQDTKVRAVVYAVIHKNYIVFKRIQRDMDGYKSRLMEWADKDIRIHSLKCLGRTYHSVDLGFLENITASRWADLVSNDGVGWELDEAKVIIRKARGKFNRMDLVNRLDGRLFFAVPKKGRLNQAALDLLEGADIQFRREHRLDIALVKNLQIVLIFLPAADIPTFVGQGRVDLGITGWDQVKEHEASVQRTLGDGNDIPGCDMVMDLGFGGCKLQVQAPEKGEYVRAEDLVGKTIGTSFVNLTADYFARLEAESVDKEHNATSAEKLQTKIVELSGSVEAACALGVADGIVDLVESGETMRAVGLKAIDTVVESTAVLVKSRSSSKADMIELIASRIRGVITAQQYVLCQYNIERSRLPAASNITPGRRAPTVTALDNEGWVAVSAMVEKKKIALVMDELSGVGASDILVIDIHNSR
ncbi:ATP phosphoribosyltransferase (ATP-PRTase) (ATP-PRT) [Conoideocrella luteorostrata]|uniref:ATP phosphoribosyltransferase n=1 Tax=Conoideocrella luteorostrata TaxID=1105319 RepID=A0AAJ0G193_9HYPO|nr:ATP phosphoribosyltransferase (ATP-PRTase) (ATP-PRT) [Conoideocrella luteorostrata]